VWTLIWYPRQGLNKNLLQKGFLILSDGTKFEGKIPVSQKNTSLGEVVFNTGMTGYVESLTDPSYSGQILAFTYPLIGNYGVQAKEVWESQKIHASGVVTSEVYGTEFVDWLTEQNVPLLTGVDTRALTKYLRTRGTMVGILSLKPKTESFKIHASNFKTPFVTVSEPKIYNEQYAKTIIAVDCGMKENIVRELCKLPYRVKRVPMDYDYSQEDFTGVFLSNGPGDPVDYSSTTEVLKKAMQKNRPIMGICLGSQLMGLAVGAKTYKLKFGHRGHNQPVQRNDGRCYITSQNHGYAVDEATIPKDWYVNFRNLNDGSVEGIAHKTKPFFSAQFHPEAAPGPTDTQFLFTQFHELL
jgi:carbamoyl-phosphate synthase small subunit